VDTLTHALSGALLARATVSKDAPPRSIPRRIAAGFFSCAAPDLDFVVGFLGPVEYLLHHRGATHSLVLLPLWALAVAWVLAKILRAPGGWRELYGVSALGIGTHIAGDVITSYGTMVFAPLSDWRAGIGTTFIIDLWFSGILVVGLVFSVLFHRSRIPSIAAAAILAGYVGFQYVQKQNALEFAQAFVNQKGLKNVQVSAQPRPVSPYNWTVFVSDDETHRIAHVNLKRDFLKTYQPGDGFVAKLDAGYLPLEHAIWVTRSRYGETDRELIRQAWNSDALGAFRWFAELPALDGASRACAWFVDLRFLTPGRDFMPFRFGACRGEPGAAWSLRPPLD